MQAGRVEIAITADDKASPTIRRVNQTVADTTKRAKVGLDGMADAGRRTQTALISLGGAAGMVKTAIGGLGVAAGIQAARGLLEAGTAAERLRRTFEYASGGAIAGREAFAFVSVEADRLGINLRASADSYARLTAAAKGTRLEGEGTRELFTGLAQASATLGLSSEQTEGALNAFQQMISKGTVQAEELRGQLAERLPGAFQMAARAMGMSTQELGKAMEKGEVFADDLIPKMAKALISDFPPAADTATQALERFKNEAQSGAAAAGQVLLVALGGAAKGYLALADAIRDANQEMGKQQAAKFGGLDPAAQAQQAAQRAAMVEGLRLAKEAKALENQKAAGPNNAQQAEIDRLRAEDAAKAKADAKAAIDEAKRVADAQIDLENQVAESKFRANQKLREMNRDVWSDASLQAIKDDKAKTAANEKRLVAEAYRAADNLQIQAMKEGKAKELEILGAREQDEINAFKLSSQAQYMAAEERQASLTAIHQRYSNERQAITQAENDAVLAASIGLAGKIGSSLQAAAGKNRAMAKAGMRISQAAAIASTAAGVMKAFEQGGVLGFVTGAGIAVEGAAQVAVIEQQLNKFAHGGIVPGTSTSGDRVPALVNSGEMILNKPQQANLFAMANGRGGGGGGVSIGDIVIQLPAGASEADGRRAGQAAADTILSRLQGHELKGKRAAYMGVEA